jgi:hypothetical protein
MRPHPPQQDREHRDHYRDPEDTMTTTRRLTTTLLAATLATTLATTPAQAHRPDSGRSTTTLTTTALPAFPTSGTLPRFLDPPTDNTPTQPVAKRTSTPPNEPQTEQSLPTAGTLSRYLNPPDTTATSTDERPQLPLPTSGTLSGLLQRD